MNTPAIPGLILAGGQSRRMGKDKTQVLLLGRPLIHYGMDILRPQVSELWINAPADYPPPDDLPVVPDRLEGHQGPLAGILAGLRHGQSALPSADGLITIPADTPFLPGDLASRLFDASAHGRRIAFAHSAGRAHPLAAFWPLSVADDLEDWMGEPQNRKVLSFIGRHDHITAEFAHHPSPVGDFDPFFNINTPDDLARAEAYAKALIPKLTSHE